MLTSGKLSKELEEKKGGSPRGPKPRSHPSIHRNQLPTPSTSTSTSIYPLNPSTSLSNPLSSPTTTSTPPSSKPPPAPGSRGHLASQPGTESESLQDMSVRGLDLLKYAQISSDGSYRCLECDKMQLQKSFKNKYSFQRHAFLYHEGQQRKVFPCPVCTKEFSRPDKMKQHLKQVHDCIIPKTEAISPPSHFIINPYLGNFEDPHPGGGGLENKMPVEPPGNEMFKLMSRLVGHNPHVQGNPGGQGAS